MIGRKIDTSKELGISFQYNVFAKELMQSVQAIEERIKLEKPNLEDHLAFEYPLGMIPMQLGDACPKAWQTILEKQQNNEHGNVQAMQI